ncbi:sulfatase-like hydrolase/transferase [Planctomycetota bacterium]|nr:sulfatase-like hydrolase/transferase [Planctomycetota bacterium]
MNKKYFKKACVIAATSTLAMSSVCMAANRPNVLVIVTDDQDPGVVGAYNSDYFTPRIDQMANNGIRFTNGNVTSTVSTPSRYSFLTGRYAGHNDAPEYLKLYPKGTNNHPDFNVQLERDEWNLPSVMQANGYNTGFVGKFHVTDHHLLRSSKNWEEGGLKFYKKNTDPKDSEITSAMMFNQRVWQEKVKAFGFDYAGAVYSANTREIFNEVSNVHNLEYTVQAGLDFLDQQKNATNPFFLYFAVTVPHGPHPAWKRDGKYKYSVDADPRLTPEGYLNKAPQVQASRDTLIPRVLNEGKKEATFHSLWFDDSVGALLDKLDELGVADDTLIIFTSDHGLRKHGKSTLYDFGMRVPFVAYWKNGILNPGRDYEHIVANIDIAPTVFEATGVDVPDKMRIDGTSFASVFKSDEEPIREALLAELGDARAIKTDRWKYIAIRYSDKVEAKIAAGEKFKGVKNEVIDRPYWFSHAQLAKRAADGHPNYFVVDQLYDLEADPDERKNVADQYPKVLEDMKQKLREELKNFPDRPFGEFTK